MVRKTVTLVFCDVADSTALGERLDPEALRDVWSRYHETARKVLERHGGTIEKFVGDAVMAAFGIPVVHEDDAVRAVRAAVELRKALTDLNGELEQAYGVRIAVRTGINTGEVIAGDPAQGQAFATGDAVVVAQRLEAAADGGEILVGASTFRLVRDAVTAAPMPALELKGKAEPVAAWRLLDVEPGVAGLLRRMDSTLVDRTAELTRLGVELGRAKAERSCRVVTIVGEPGVGKSRLAAELFASLGGEALVLEGSCLPYGTGITYWPLVELVRRLDLPAVLGAEPDGEVVHGRILEAVGRAEPGSRSDELYWAVRRLLETLARRRPVVLVLDDIQWAEPTLLDLVEYLAGWSRDAAIFICCLARTEFAELRPGWTLLPLGPLSPEDSATLLGNLVGPLEPAATRELGRVTGGNPLFLEEMVRMLAEDEQLVERDGRLVAELDSLRVPATIQAVLAARLDRLGDGERDVLQRASVIGQVFWWGPVTELTPPDRVAAVPGQLQALVRKGLVRPDQRTLAGEDGFCFAHILVRDAAYESMPKRRRGELHERFADWVESRAPDAAEYDEILGHHLEQALAYRLALAPAGAPEAALAERAAGRLARAGRRALARDDAHAAVNLLGRASTLRAEDPALLLDHADARAQLGEIRAAEETFGAALEAAVVSRDRRTEICAQLELGMIGLLTRAEVRVDELAAEVERALPAFEQAGDDATLARLLTRLAEAYWWRCRIGAMQDVLERALVHARRAGDERQVANVAVRLGFAAIIGPLPVAEGRRFLADALDRTADETSSKGMLLLTSALLAALEGDFDDARGLVARGTQILDALGRSVGLAAISTWTAAIDLLAGDAVSAERDLRAALDQLDRVGQRANAASVAAQLAETLVSAGRYEEAASLTGASEAAASPDDVHAQIAWRVARAKVSAALGDGAAAEQIARQAVGLAYETDSPFYTAEALEALAVALDAAGRPTEAEAAAGDALRLLEAKGNRVGAARIRTARAAVRTASTPG